MSKISSIYGSFAINRADGARPWNPIDATKRKLWNHSARASSHLRIPPALYLLLLRLLHQPPLSPCADLLGTDGRNNRHSKRGGEDLWKRTGDSMVEE